MSLSSVLPLKNSTCVTRPLSLASALTVTCAGAISTLPLAGEVMLSVGGTRLALSTTCTWVPLSWRTLSTPVALS